MKKILLTIFAAAVGFTAQSQWLNQNLPLTYIGYINDMEVVDANVAWGNPWNGSTGVATPYTSDFARTIDGGTTWSIGNIGAAAGFVVSNIYPIDANTCYVCMCDITLGGGAVYKTTNGGTSWSPVGANMFQQSTSFGNVVYFWDANNGMAMGDPVGPTGSKRYELYTTNDAGATWIAVPTANIPVITNAAEYGITNLFAAAGGNIWFGTTYGDVYKSTDMGLSWTKSATGLPAGTGTTRQDINDIAFYDDMNGVVVQTDGTAGTYILKSTTDGGTTWNNVTVTSGTFYPSDVEGVPGSNILVSAGSNNVFGFGSSFSNDLGVTWNDIDLNVSHTSLDFVNSTTGSSGEFITAGSTGGVWKFNGILAILACGDPLISVGTSSANDSLICFNDTLRFSTSGAIAANSPAAVESGFAVLVSSADISGNNDPFLTAGSVILGGTPAIAANTTIQLVNDGTIFPQGAVYYLTAMVFANATGTAGQLITTYNLDSNCTIMGQSVMVNLLDVGDPLCTVGFANLDRNDFSISELYPVPVKDMLNFSVTMKSSTDITVSIRDITGRVIFANTHQANGGKNEISFPMTKYSAGVYTVTVSSGKNTTTRKFIKQ